jgi:RNA polymerase sigma-70 factor (ECF subfamily)
MNTTAALASATTRELVAAAQSGTDASLPALNRLLEANEGLCRSVVLNVRRGETPVDDDLLQTARLAFVRAVHKYRPGTATLSTFAWSVMHRAVLNEARRRHRGESRLRRAEASAELSTPDDELTQGLERLALREALAALPPADRDLLARLYEWDRTQSGIAVDLGVSHTAVHKRHRRILTNLRFALSA